MNEQDLMKIEALMKNTSFVSIT